MAENNSKHQDLSRFQLRSYGWRDIDIGADRAISLLEQAFQSAGAIQAISATLRAQLISSEGDESFDFGMADRLLGAIEQLSINLTNGTCSYASAIETKVEARRQA
jgi:hypothetical protein